MTSSVHIPLPEGAAPLRPDWPILACRNLSDEPATDALANALTQVLAGAEIILLSGTLGAGKTHFARAFIRSWMADPDEPVPSPTFTLVQIFDTPRGQIWHADLYRLTDAQEVLELGLDDALGQNLCLIEWPDRLAPNWPIGLLLHFEILPDGGRLAYLQAPPTRAVADNLVKAFTA